MEPVPQKVLNWLHSVLLGEYQDVNRTYSDVARCLADYRGLRTSTNVYTYEDGRPSLLLRIKGTIPVSFRGDLYSFPIQLWIPKSYPREAPMSFVDPTPDMSVRPGQHVSGEGRIYHPYLANWRPDKSTITELVRILQDVFARETPVIARQRPPPPAQQQKGGPPPVPPLPQELGGPGNTSQADVRQTRSPPQPPPPPPRPALEQRRSDALLPSRSPPVPAHSPQRTQFQARDTSIASKRESYHGQSQHASHRYSQPPPLPTDTQQRPSSIYHAQGPISSHAPASPPVAAWVQEQAQQLRYQQGQPQHPPQSTTGHHYQQHQPHPPNYSQPQLPQAQYHPSHQAQPQQLQQQPQPHPSHPPLDLLTSPFDPPLPTASSPLPAPPIPPNPEKDALLSSLSHTLTTQLHSIIASNKSAQAPLQAQYAALQTANQNLSAEQAALNNLASMLAQNESILHSAMRDADAVIARAKDTKVPGVDEVLVAPTVVGQQMYELVAEEKACAEAREVLGRALDRGRVGVEAWVKATRGLAREEFQKKWLIKKGASGMRLVGAERSDGEQGEATEYYR